MKYIVAVLAAIKDSVVDTTARVAGYFWDCVKNALRRPALIPVGLAVAVGVCWISPFFAAGLVAVVVNDPGGHPVVRMALDAAAIAAAVSLVMLLPALGMALAALPAVDLLNRFVDRVEAKLRELEPKPVEVKLCPVSSTGA